MKSLDPWSFNENKNNHPHKGIKSHPIHASDKHLNSHMNDIMIKLQNDQTNILSNVIKTSVPRLKINMLSLSLQANAIYLNNIHIIIWKTTIKAVIYQEMIFTLNSYHASVINNSIKTQTKSKHARKT